MRPKFSASFHMTCMGLSIMSHRHKMDARAPGVSCRLHNNQQEDKNFFLCVFCSESKHSEGRNDRKYAPSPFLMGGWFQSLAREIGLPRLTCGQVKKLDKGINQHLFLRINPAGIISGCHVTEKQKFFLALSRCN